MVRVLSKVDLYGLTDFSVALADVVAAIHVGVGLVFAPDDVGRPSSPYSWPCYPHMLGIMPSGSGVAPRSWRLLLVVWIL